MKIALHNRMGLGALLLVALIGYLGAQAIPVVFVDGGCSVDGNGTVVSPCAATPGGAGPYNSIGEAIQNAGGSTTVQAIASGIKLEIRGAHDAFDGRYTEGVWLGNLASRPAGLPFGKAWNCTGGPGSCIIEGCRAANGCPADELPTISGMIPRRDWVAVTIGVTVYHRDMEASPNSWPTTGTERGDGFDPETIYQVNGSTFRPLLYAGDTAVSPNIATFAAGSWMYQIDGSHRVWARPFSDTDPTAANVLYVPHFGTSVWLETPSQNVWMQYVNIEGARTVNNNWCTSLGACPGTRLQHGWVRFAKLYANHIHSATGILVDDWNCDTVGQGVSTTGISDGVFCFRTFRLNNSTFQNIIAENIGSDGVGGNGGHHSPWMPNPWGHSNLDASPCTGPPTCTAVRSNGLAFQWKQCNNVTGTNLAVLHSSAGAYSIDVCSNVTLNDISAENVRDGITASNFTPTFPASCAVGDTTCDFRWWANLVVNRATLTWVGSSTRLNAPSATDTACAINLQGDDATQWGAWNATRNVSFLAHLSNIFVLNGSYGTVCIGNGTLHQVSPPGGIDIEYLTAAGTRTATATSTPFDILGTATSRGIVIATASDAGGGAACSTCEHGVHVNNMVYNTDLVNELGVIGGDTPAFAGYVPASNLLSTNPVGIGFDYSTLGEAGSVLRSGGTVPFQNTAPSGGTLATLAAFKSAFSLQYTHNSTQQDPLLVSATTDALQAGSPAKEAGHCNTIAVDDRIKTPRPQSTLCDQGSSELCTGPCVSTTSTTATTTTATTLLNTTTTVTTTTTTTIGSTNPGVSIY